MVFENEGRYIDPLDLAVMKQKKKKIAFLFLKALGALCWVQRDLTQWSKIAKYFLKSAGRIEFTQGCSAVCISCSSGLCWW